MPEIMKLLGLLLLLPLFVLLQLGAASNSEENALEYNFGDECSMMVCRSGRECKLNGNGEASCVCMATCPDHFVPVCGSNGQSYDNYCMMHRDACLSDVHISLKKKGYCSDKDTSSSTSTHEQEQSFFEPVVCFQWERDALRRQMLSHFRQHSIDHSWYRPGLKQHEKLEAEFESCDSSADDFLDANEFAACVTDVPFALRTTPSSNKLVKVLCVDAIVDAGDKNSDWRLDLAEYKALMDSTFQPKEKLCSLEGKQFEDGSQTKVDCNECVCACGSWVCSSKSCHDHVSDIDQLLDEDDDDNLDDEMINDDDQDQDVDDLGEKNKILKIEEDDAIIDPDEDELIPRYINLDDYQDDAFQDDNYDYDYKAEKKSKTRKSY